MFYVIAHLYEYIMNRGISYALLYYVRQLGSVDNDMFQILGKRYQVRRTAVDNSHNKPMWRDVECIGTGSDAHESWQQFMSTG